MSTCSGGWLRADSGPLNTRPRAGLLRPIRRCTEQIGLFLLGQSFLGSSLRAPCRWVPHGRALSHGGAAATRPQAKQSGQLAMEKAMQPCKKGYRGKAVASGLLLRASDVNDKVANKA